MEPMDRRRVWGDGVTYENYMGRWSRLIGREFLKNLSGGQQVNDLANIGFQFGVPLQERGVPIGTERTLAAYRFLRPRAQGQWSEQWVISGNEHQQIAGLIG